MNNVKALSNQYQEQVFFNENKYTKHLLINLNKTKNIIN